MHQAHRGATIRLAPGAAGPWWRPQPEAQGKTARQHRKARQLAGSTAALVHCFIEGAVPGVNQTPHGSVGSFLVGFVKVMGGPSQETFWSRWRPSNEEAGEA